MITVTPGRVATPAPGMPAAMSDVAENLTDKVRETAHREAAEYAQGEDRPLAGYTATMGTYALTAAALVAASRLMGRRGPAAVPWADLALSSLATFKLSRLIARDPVTSPLRAPFTHYDGLTGPSELHEEPREDSTWRHAIGELLTCPFCVSQWVATGFVSGLVLAPRFTRLAASTFGVVAVSDFLQFAHAAIEQATGEAK